MSLHISTPPFRTSTHNLSPSSSRRSSSLEHKYFRSQPIATHHGFSPLSSQIFLRVEEESERRAHERAEVEAQQSNVASPMTTTVVRDRRRGSVSVSRFGQGVENTIENKPNDTLSSVASYVTRKPTFYQADSNVHGSADSLASATDGDLPQHDHTIEEEQVVQMATIAGKQSLSKAFSRKLSRSRTRSRDVLTSSFVIGVSVEEATVETEAEEVYSATSVSFAHAHTPGALRPQRSKMSIVDRSERAGWMDKARDLTQKFRRRSAAALTQQEAGR
ncbi:uncharacterized protein FIBRA_05101 [Fibroporia radiculosa]|uniref:Uncharacterized protein n=1 Tax=Fibroporia radiculosa TaxID=599839 RepID=J4IAI8_9APHY|nr:uncharacterized protein FIBRA_05101 [Fibroporia radiculosa]CCM02986.1 predicted protein [Fibroporia radiculosa]